MQNILSIDFECFISVYEQFNRLVEKQSKTSEERKKEDNGYIVKAAENLLDILDSAGVKATFFVVAEINDWYPKLIEKIYKKGHEIGFHTYSHKRIFSKDILIEEINKSSRFIKHFKPKGFRAPQMYITRESFKILKQSGFTYDSSSYGAFNIRKIDGVIEFPVSVYRFRKKKGIDVLPRNSTFSLLKHELPVGAGFFIGVLGNKTSLFIERANNKNQPFIMFLHPWQIEKPPVKKITLIRGAIENPLMASYYINREKTFKYLLEKHEFTSFQEYIKRNKIK